MADYPVEHVIGAINLAGGCIVQAVPVLSGVQALSGAGALNVTQFVTQVTSTGAAQVLTLADGVTVGQRKRVVHVVDGGSVVITPTDAAFTTVTLATVGEFAELIWTGSKWNLVDFGNSVTGGATLMPVVV